MKRQWKLKKILVASLVMLLFVVARPLSANATNPDTISFQGKVVNANGTNVSDGSYGFVFKLYTVSSGGSAVWTETDTLSVSGGVFQVNLGAGCPFFTANSCNGSSPINFSSDPNLYLGITFNSDPAGEMSPRIQLQSVPFAFNADNLGGLNSSQYTQLSPGSQQSGYINISGGATFGGSQTFSGSSAQSITGPSTGGLSVTVASGPLTLSTTSSGILDINSAGSLNITGAGISTWDIGANTLSLQTTSNGPITTGSGLLTAGGALTIGAGNLTFSGSTARSIVGPGAGGLTLSDATGAVNITGGANSTWDIGNNTLSLQTTNNGPITTGSGLLTDAGDTTQTVSSGVTANINSHTITNSNASSTASTVNDENIALAGHSNGTSNANTINGLNFANVATIANNAFNALYVGTGFNNAIQGAGSLNITGAGISTWDIGANTLSLQTTSNGPITTGSGLLTAGGALTIGAGNLTFSGSTARSIVGPGAGGLTLSDATGAVNITGGANSTWDIGNNTLSLQTTNNGPITTGSGLLTDAGDFAVDGASTLSDTGETSLAVTGAPVATATVSLVQFGAAIAGGNATSGTGGTYLGINQPSSGAGSTADFTNFENNGASKFDINSSGTITSAGGISAGEDVDDKATETTAQTYTETTADVGYYLASDSTTTNTTFTTIFNITGLPSVNGTFAAITGVAQKSATTGSVSHTTEIEINSTLFSTLKTATGLGASTTRRSFIVMYQNGAWTLIGSAPTATPASTTSQVSAADYAEWIDYSGDNAPQPGNVLSISANPDSVQLSQSDYDKNLVGVVSTNPYEVGGADDGHSVIIALSGRVPVDVDLENGPIQIGDPLTASSTPGVAMKATSPGRIIGIALDSYDGSQPDAQVTVQLGVGYNDPTPNGVINSGLTTSGALTLNSGSSNNASLDTSISGSPINIGSLSAGAINISQTGQTTTISGGLVVNQGSTFNSGVTMNFTNSNNLQLNSDLKGTINGISFVGTPSTTAGTKNGIFIQQANSSNTNGLSSGLTIDNANSTLPINSAIAFTNSGGGGYNSLIDGPGFSVSGSGLISGSGLSINLSGGNSFTVNGPIGPVVSIDSSGNANFSGDLNLSSASLSGGLTVEGNANFAGPTSFQKLATFLADTIFKQNVEFDGHLTVASDSAGYASLRVGETKVHVNFSLPYQNPPVVTAQQTNGQFGLVSVNNVTDQGFDVELMSPALAMTTLSWTAVAVNNPQTASNPLPETVTTNPTTPSVPVTSSAQATAATN